MKKARGLFPRQVGGLVSLRSIECLGPLTCLTPKSFERSKTTRSHWNGRLAELLVECSPDRNPSPEMDCPAEKPVCRCVDVALIWPPLFFCLMWRFDVWPWIVFLLRRDAVEAPETTLAGRVATRDQSDRVAKARGVAGQVDDADAPPPAEPNVPSSPPPEPKTTDRSAAMQRLLDAKRKKQQGGDA